MSTLDQMVARWSKFSGFKLQWKIEDGVFKVTDPRDPCRSGLRLKLIFPDGLTLFELYGRMRHWGITWEEKMEIARALGSTYFSQKSVPAVVNPFDF